MGDAAHALAYRTLPVLPQDRFDVVLLGILELEAAPGEELDAVVGHGVVGGGDDRTHLHVEHAGQVGDARSGDDAHIDHVEAA